MGKRKKEEFDSYLFSNDVLAYAGQVLCVAKIKLDIES